jgi:transposase InsO family protein
MEEIRAAHAGSRGHLRSAAGPSRWSQADRAADGAERPCGGEPRKFVTTTVKDGGHQALDLVERNFVAERPNLLWVADITYIPTWAMFLYLAVVLDAFSRRIVGWSTGTTLATRLVLDALNMALTTRRPNGVIHRSERRLCIFIATLSHRHVATTT